MQKTAAYATLFLLIIMLCSCSRDKEKEAEVDVNAFNRSTAVALIGDSGLSSDEVLSYVQARSRRGSAKKVLQQAVEELTVAELMAQEAVRLGMNSRPEVRQAIRQLLGQQLMKELVTEPVLKRHLSEEELRMYYNDHLERYVRPEQIRLADIFIAAPVTGDKAVREMKKKEAEDILRKVRRRSIERFSFSELTKEYSDKHPQYRFGDTGFFDREGQPGGLPEELAVAGFSLENNGTVFEQVIETDAGFHIVKLVARRQGSSREFDTVVMELEQRMRKEALVKKRGSLIASLKKKGKAQIQEKVFVTTLQKLENMKEQYGVSGAGSESDRPMLPGH